MKSVRAASVGGFASLLTSRMEGASTRSASFPSMRPSALESLLGAARWLWRKGLATRQAKLSSRRMRLVETVALGEKRFVAMLEVDGERYLIGGGTGQVALLSRLDPASDNAHAPAASWNGSAAGLGDARE